MRGRPIKERFIQKPPRIFKFSPRGIRGRPDKVILQTDELEAIRLADLNNMKHQDAAGVMRVSRQTFDRILKKGRKALADGIVSGKIVTIRDIPKNTTSKQ